MADYKRADYLRHEAEIAHRNSQAADTIGRYAEAAWCEAREAELWDEIRQEEKNEVSVHP